MVRRPVLVLGGTGFLGGAIVDAYLATGAEVRVLARRDPGRREGAWARATVIQGDIHDPAAVARAVEGAGRVIYAVGGRPPAASNAEPIADATETLGALVTALESCRNSPGCTFTFLSSGGAVHGEPHSLPVREGHHGTPLTSYGIGKLAGEHYVGMYARLYGLPALVLRVANAYGPGQPWDRGQGAVAAFLHAASTASPVFMYGEGRVVRDWVHVEDVARAVVELAGRPDVPPVVNVGSGVGHSIAEVRSLVEQVTGTVLQVRDRPHRPLDPTGVVLDVSVLTGLMAWHPRSLRDGVTEWWRLEHPRRVNLPAERESLPV